jgi:Zn-dependent protease
MDNIFISKLFSDPQEYFLWILLVVFSVCVHEFFHALTALWQGDRTAADNGHLTLNPFVQMGITSLIVLCLMGLAWGSVPVTPSRMRHRYSHVLVSISGPLANALLFTVFCIACAVSVIVFKQKPENSPYEAIVVLFGTGAILNVVLFLFNMLPIPPLDGFSLLAYFFPAAARRDSEFKNAFFLGMFIFAFLFFGKVYIFAVLLTKYVITILIGILHG